MDNNDFGQRIAELRRGKMLSQRELGERLGVSNKAVSKWETGEAMPQMKTIVKIASLFEISPDELLTGTKFEAASNDFESAKSNRIDALESENIKLKNDLQGASRKNKKALGVSIIICVIAAVSALLIILYNTQQTKNPNDGAKALGKSGTAIELCGARFVPANDFEKNIANENYIYDIYGGDEKYAVFIDEDKKESKVLVCPIYGTDFISVNQGDKAFVYINEKNRIVLKKENIVDITLRDEDYYVVNTLYQIDYFLEYYDAKKEPENAQEITKIYFNNNRRIVEVWFENYIHAELGSVFEDNEKNIYFYDYMTAKTYEMGDKLYEYTKQ